MGYQWVTCGFVKDFWRFLVAPAEDPSLFQGDPRVSLGQIWYQGGFSGSDWDLWSAQGPSLQFCGNFLFKKQSGWRKYAVGRAANGCAFNCMSRFVLSSACWIFTRSRWCFDRCYATQIFVSLWLVGLVWFWLRFRDFFGRWKIDSVDVIFCGHLFCDKTAFYLRILYLKAFYMLDV